MNIIKLFVNKFKKWQERRRRFKELQEKIWTEEIKKVYGTYREERVKDYERYIISDEWKKLRDLAFKKANGKCQLCNNIASEVHHMEYPRVFSEDSLDNLLVCCKKCHKLQHGIKGNQKSITDYEC